MGITWSDGVAYGYIVLTVTGAAAAPLSRAFPQTRWLATVAKVCVTLGPHWGVLAALASRSNVPPPAHSDSSIVPPPPGDAEK